MRGVNRRILPSVVDDEAVDDPAVLAQVLVPENQHPVEQKLGLLLDVGGNGPVGGRIELSLGGQGLARQVVHLGDPSIQGRVAVPGPEAQVGPGWRLPLGDVTAFAQRLFVTADGTSRTAPRPRCRRRTSSIASRCSADQRTRLCQ